jgi:hypothetical protein
VKNEKEKEVDVQTDNLPLNSGQELLIDGGDGFVSSVVKGNGRGFSWSKPSIRL